jgi:phage terminase large subunit GpA-like protein
MMLTAGCDVQRNRLEIEIVAWGPNLESWSIEYLILEGDTSTIQTDPARPCPWRELSRLLGKEWQTEDGGSLVLTRMAVDSGDQTQTVYGWVRSQYDLRVMATKGMDSQTGIVGLPKAQDLSYDGRMLKGGVKVWPLGSSVGKRELYGWLKADRPAEGESLPRGWCHFPEYGEEYFQGLTAEQLVMRTHRGFAKWAWEKVRTRNEPLDCRVMARAALAATGADKWSPEQWKDRANRIGLKLTERVRSAPKATEAPPSAAREESPRRENKRGGWLHGGGSGRGGGWLGGRR